MTDSTEVIATLNPSAEERPEDLLPVARPYLVAQPPPPEPEPEYFVPMRIRDLRAGDRVVMYGTIVAITDMPYNKHRDSAACELGGLQEGWVHVPMIWDAIACAPGEPADLLVAVHRPGLSLGGGRHERAVPRPARRLSPSVVVLR